LVFVLFSCSKKDETYADWEKSHPEAPNNVAPILNDSIEEKAQQQRDLEQMVRKIQNESERIDGFSSEKSFGNVQTIQLELDFFSNCQKLVSEAEGLPLFAENSEAMIVLNGLKKKLVSLQNAEFPKLRKAYGKIAKEDLWIHNIDVLVKGNRSTTIEFVGGYFANNSNIKETQDALSEILNGLRFKRVNYKWYKYDEEYTYYTLRTVGDNELQ
jgi:hypothetical protein